MQQGLTSFFSEYVDRKGIFREKAALQSQFFPNIISHRDEQINSIASILAPSLKREKPSNLFIYGSPGSGKTVCIKHIMAEIQKIAILKELPIRSLYVNCKLRKVADTEYRLIAELARDLGKAVPATGLPTEEIYKLFVDGIRARKQTLILVLDEIDHLVKKIGDEVLYNLTRINEELSGSMIIIVGISNDVVFAHGMDPRVKSSLSEEEITFPPYNAVQIQDILSIRAQMAFTEGVIMQGVIEKCAAYAARDHGDVRRALELLRISGEITERNGLSQVTSNELDMAEECLEKDRIFELVHAQPRQYKAVLYAFMLNHGQKPSKITTKDVYESYGKIALRCAMPSLTQRRVSDIIADFDSAGILSAKVISKGRHGRTRELTLCIPNAFIPKIKKSLEEGLLL